MERHLLRIWNEVERDTAEASTEWIMAETLRIYNNTYPNNQADLSDLRDALEKAGDR